MMKHYLMRHDATVDRKNESEEINLTLQKENSFLSFFFFLKNIQMVCFSLLTLIFCSRNVDLVTKSKI